MDLHKDFEIILITYNRIEYLQNTFNQIFADNSPIKNLPMTILDNKSTDGTSELIQEYARKFPNIKHIIHNRNIGGNANIARAFEMASKKYVWILCDDDEYDWRGWDEAVQAMENNYDAIVVANYSNPEKNLAQLVKQLTFVPGAIYKTENITETVMVNAEFNLSNMFAQLAIVCHLINENKRFYICKKGLVTMIPHGGEETYTRGLENGYIHPYMKNILWPVGFCNSIRMIKDKDMREYILDNVTINDDNWLKYCLCFLELNRDLSNNSSKNFFDVFCALNFRQRLAFGFCWFLHVMSFVTGFIGIDDEKIKLNFFGILKTHIRYKPKSKTILEKENKTICQQEYKKELIK